MIGESPTNAPSAYQSMRANAVYWAMEPGEDVLPYLEQRIKWYYQHIETTGRLALWRRALAQFRGYDPDGSWANSNAVTFGGDSGEIVQLVVNHFAGIIQGKHALITGVRPTTKAVAAMGTSASQDDASIADKILQWDVSQKRVGELLARAALVSMHAGEGWIYQHWDPMKGEVSKAQLGGAAPGVRADGAVVRAGDVATYVKHPIDVVRDPDAMIEGDSPAVWRMVRLRVNRWDLMQQFPEKWNEIANVPSCRKRGDGSRDDQLYVRDTRSTTGNDDYIYVWHFYHESTPALPAGRFVMFCKGVFLMESPMPYADMPLHPIYPDVDDEDSFGFTPMWHLMAPQRAYDSIVSAAVSNVDAGGLNNIWLPTGQAVDISKLSSGFNVIKSAEKPEVLQFGVISKDAMFVANDVLLKAQQMISGMNSVALGQPDDSLKSGAALALVQSMSVQHNSGDQRGYSGLIERVFSSRVRIWQRFVTEERVAEIAGDDDRMTAKQWTGDSLKGVSRVAVELSNPIMSTTQGRMELATFVVTQLKFPMTPEELFGVLETGRLEPIMQHAAEEMRSIARENQRLRDAPPPPPPPEPILDPFTGAPMPPPPPELPVKALVTDKHRLHIREHACLLADPEVRFGPLAELVLAHIQEHINALSTTNPIVLEAIGEPPPTVVMGPMGPMPGPGAPPAGPAPEGGPRDAPPMARNEVTGGEAKLPNMPTNPATGERAQVQSGFQ